MLHTVFTDNGVKEAELFSLSDTVSSYNFLDDEIIEHRLDGCNASDSGFRVTTTDGIAVEVPENVGFYTDRNDGREFWSKNKLSVVSAGELQNGDMIRVFCGMYGKGLEDFPFYQQYAPLIVATGSCGVWHNDKCIYNQMLFDDVAKTKIKQLADNCGIPYVDNYIRTGIPALALDFSNFSLSLECLKSFGVCAGENNYKRKFKPELFKLSLKDKLHYINLLLTAYARKTDWGGVGISLYSEDFAEGLRLFLSSCGYFTTLFSVPYTELLDYRTGQAVAVPTWWLCFDDESCEELFDDSYLLEKLSLSGCCAELSGCFAEEEPVKGEKCCFRWSKVSNVERVNHRVYSFSVGDSVDTSNVWGKSLALCNYIMNGCLVSEL